MPFSRRDPARCVVSCEPRADHELNLMEHHQWYDNEPNVPGEQQGCYRQAGRSHLTRDNGAHDAVSAS